MYEQEFDRWPRRVVDISDRWNHMKNSTEIQAMASLKNGEKFDEDKVWSSAGW